MADDITFTNPDSSVRISNPAKFAGTILGFAPGDTIDLAGVTGAVSATLGPGNLLSIATGKKPVNLQLDPTQNYSFLTFSVAPDGKSGTDVTFGAPFYQPNAGGEFDFQGFPFDAYGDGSPLGFSIVRDEIGNELKADASLTGASIQENLNPYPVQVLMLPDNGQPPYLGPGPSYQSATFGLSELFHDVIGTIGLSSGLASAIGDATASYSGQITIATPTGTVTHSFNSQDFGSLPFLATINYPADVTVSLSTSEDEASGVLGQEDGVAEVALSLTDALIPATSLSAGQTLNVESGDNPIGFIVETGAHVNVFSGGTTLDFEFLGGREIVYAGGEATGTYLANGGELEVYGSASGTYVAGGGSEIVLSGGSETDPTIDGGTLEFRDGATVGGTIDFAGTGGTLQIDGATLPTNVISGFGPGDTIDLRGIASRAGGTAIFQANNLLQITEGANSHQLSLDPTMDYAGETLQLVKDGHGGTDLVDLAGPSGGISVTAGNADTLYLGPSDTVNGGSTSTIFAGPNDAIQDGSNDTVNLSGLTAGTGGALIQDTGTQITDTVIGFAEGVDHLSFAGETAASEAAVVASAKVHNGNTVLTYPDHSTITLVGLTHADTGIFA